MGLRAVGFAVAVAAAVALCAGCAGPTTDTAVSAYVDAAIAEMRDGIHADSEEFRRAVDDLGPTLRAAPTIADTYAGLQQLAVAAGGEHSSFAPPVDVAAYEAADQPGAAFAVPTASTSAGVTRLTLPSFNGQSAEAMSAYVDAGLTAMRDAVSATTCGWIIDLRTNGGGNAWPMLAVAAPLLDDGDVVGLQRDGEIAWARVEDGGVVSTPGGPDTTTPGGFTIDAPVALMTSSMTASAAEIVAIAFQGQDDAVRVGKPTAGLTTGNEVRELSDGSWLILTTTYDVDRAGTLQNGPLIPDVEVAPGPDLEAARTAVTSRCG